MEVGWYTQARTHPAGKLALYWVNAVAADWKEAGDDNWQGLSNEMRATLNALLAGDDHRTAMAEAILASQLGFFSAADREWCLEKILPLFNWDTPDQAGRAWDGFLAVGVANPHLLEDGLLDRYIETASEHMGDLQKEAKDRLFQHLAAIALRSSVYPLTWIEEFTAKIGDKTVREKWVRAITGHLPSLPEGAVELQWERWMREYWQRRIRGIPRMLTKPEASAMASWVLELEAPTSIAEGVELALSSPAQLRENTDLLYDLAEGKFEKAPSAYGKLVAHLLKGTKLSKGSGFWECPHLDKIVQQLRAFAQEDSIEEIKTHALILGCREASEW